MFTITNDVFTCVNTSCWDLTHMGNVSLQCVVSNQINVSIIEHPCLEQSHVYREYRCHYTGKTCELKSPH